VTASKYAQKYGESLQLIDACTGIALLILPEQQAQNTWHQVRHLDF